MAYLIVVETERFELFFIFLYESISYLLFLRRQIAFRQGFAYEVFMLLSIELAEPLAVFAVCPVTYTIKRFDGVDYGRAIGVIKWRVAHLQTPSQ
jgi:hypothetical protein